MNNTTTDRERLVKTLRMQAGTLAALLEHPQRDKLNFHVALAGPIRSMLCDADWPTLIKLGELLDADLRVWGPHPPSDIYKPAPTFSMNALTVSAEPVAFSHEMSLAEFLDAPIGAIALTDPSTGGQKGNWYTPRQLIKWAANKEGPAHFDPRAPAKYQALSDAIMTTGSVSMIEPSGETPITQNDSLLVRMALLQIAQVTLCFANGLLAQCPIAEA